MILTSGCQVHKGPDLQTFVPLLRGDSGVCSENRQATRLNRHRARNVNATTTIGITKYIIWTLITF